MRFWTGNGQLLETSVNLGNVSQANPGVVTTVAVHGLNVGDEVFIDGGSDMVELNSRNYEVNTVPTTTTLTLKDKFGTVVDTSTGYTLWSAGGSLARVFTLVTPITDAQKIVIQYDQSGDVIYIAHEDFHPLRLTRTAATTWAIVDVPFVDGPYLPENDTTTTMTPSGTSGSITMTASAAAFTLVTDVGRLIRFKSGASDWGYGKITAVASTVSATVTVVKAFGGTTVGTRWNLGLWSDTTGYPAAVVFHEERLTFGGGEAFPRKTVMSWSADFERFSPTDYDDSIPDEVSIIINPSFGNLDPIRWYSSGRVLAAGTIGSVFRVSGSDTSEPITPTSITAKREVTRGTAVSRALQIDNATLYIQKNKRKLREFLYNFEIDGYQSGDLTILANHILRGNAKKLAYQQEPHSVVWVLTEDGVLHGLTYQKDQQVVGWNEHTFGGADVLIEDIAVIPGTTEDRLWIAASLTVDSVTNRYMGFLDDFFKIGGSITKEDAFFVDFGATYSGSATNVIYNLFHLRGEVVSVLADGKPQPPLTVTALGKLTLPNSITPTKVHIGKSNTCAFETLPPEVGNQLGTAQGKIVNIERTKFRFIESLGGSAGVVDNDMEPIKEINDISLMNSANELFSGDVEIELQGSVVVNDPFKGRIRFENSQPLPSHLLAVMPEIEVGT
jgi:hypothetical protein